MRTRCTRVALVVPYARGFADVEAAGAPAADVPGTSSGHSPRAPPGPAHPLHASRWSPAPGPPPRTSAHRLRAHRPSEESLRPTKVATALCTPAPLSVSQRRLPPLARVPHSAPMAEAAALTADEAKIYDRQIRVWGVETQQRCVLPSSRSPLLSTVLTDACQPAQIVPLATRAYRGRDAARLRPGLTAITCNGTAGCATRRCCSSGARALAQRYQPTSASLPLPLASTVCFRDKLKRPPVAADVLLCSTLQLRNLKTLSSGVRACR